MEVESSLIILPNTILSIGLSLDRTNKTSINSPIVKLASRSVMLTHFDLNVKEFSRRQIPCSPKNLIDHVPSIDISPMLLIFYIKNKLNHTKHIKNPPQTFIYVLLIKFLD